MEEIEIRDALRRHVVSGEPPLGLTAAHLLDQGRHRQRWRLGLGLGTGGAAAAVLVAGSLTIAPLAGTPSLEDTGCTLPLAVGWTPRPSAQPIPPFLSPLGTPAPGASEMDPLFGGPSVNPTESAVAPTDPPVSPTSMSTVQPTDGPGPSFQPTDPPASWPTQGPTQGPLPTPNSTAWHPPTPAPRPQKVVDAQCYLMHKLQELFPRAKFAGGTAPRPFEFSGGPGGYASNGEIIVRNDAEMPLHLLFDKPEEGPPAPNSYGWKTRTINGVRVDTYTDEGMIQARAFHAHTMALAFEYGFMLNAESLANMLAAPELDILD